jgi:hypothetical protein
MGRTFALCLFVVAFLHSAESQDVKVRTQPQPAATLGLSASPRSGHVQSGWASVAFTSETSIAAGICLEDYLNQECSLVLVRWESGTLQPFAKTLRFDSGVSIHPTSQGQILAVHGLSPAVLYSADLSTVHELPIEISHFFSPSGETVAQWARGSWKLYRLIDRLEPLREGTGYLQSLSDEFVLVQDRKIMRVESLDGKQFGSFSVPSGVEGYYASTGLLGNSKLYLDDCKIVRIADFDGRTLLKIRPRKGCSSGDTESSADGRRILFDYTSREVSGLKHMIESVRTLTTLGMVGPEDVNREHVRVFDTATGKPCFEWSRIFPMTYSQVRSAAISPSGQFAAIVTNATLSIYLLPADCGDSVAIPPDK